MSFLERKEYKLLNKKFQKFRKMAFLSAFDHKIMRLSHILQDKVDRNLKEGFKDLVNYCIRNDPYKKEVEKLNYQFQS